MKKNFIYFFLILLFNFNISLYADDSPKNYLEGKFYKSVKDNFLVATKKMDDPRFAKSVIVMFENDENGAWGLAINKPLGSIPINKLIDLTKSSNAKKDKLYNVEIPIYWGGPVNKNKIFILHSNEYKSETTKKYNSISISSDYETLLEIAENKGPEKKLIILGISSWGGGQLEGEMERDHWILSEINTDLIFDRDNLKKWINALNSGFVRL